MDENGTVFIAEAIKAFAVAVHDLAASIRELAASNVSGEVENDLPSPYESLDDA
mgnify:CR=1 FL=1